MRMRSMIAARGHPEASISYWTATSHSGRSSRAAISRQPRHRVEELGLAIDLGDHRQERLEDGHAHSGQAGREQPVEGHEVRLDGQHEGAQQAAAVDGDLVARHQLGQLGRERRELLLADLPLGVEDQECVGVADGVQRKPVDRDRLHHAAAGGVADQLGPGDR